MKDFFIQRIQHKTYNLLPSHNVLIVSFYLCKGTEFNIYPKGIFADGNICATHPHFNHQEK
jgi:hypothetical protein